jgi:transcription initiation factor TFIID subunit 5
VTSASTTSVHASSWEESTGLLSSLLPAGGSYTNPQAFNTAKGELKLGPKPLNEELRLETERTLREHAMLEPSGQYDQSLPQPNVPGLVSPTTSELAPHPPLFKQIDVRREVERVRDARKRIRLEPSVLGNVDINSPQGAAIRSRVLPSICAYTLHDVGEGSVKSLILRGVEV